MEIYNQGVQKLTGVNQKVVLSQVFNFRLGHLAFIRDVHAAQAHQHLEVKTRPRFHRVNVCSCYSTNVLSISIVVLPNVMAPKQRIP